MEHDVFGKPVRTFPDHALVDEPHLPRQVPIDAHGAGGGEPAECVTELCGERGEEVVLRRLRLSKAASL